ncbi:NAD(P)-binding protein [Gordonia sp. HNM0687]|uniref:NAD(P)-binding protein n=1 Tax=Gordonia mangrovi TaxID=2665643 RepID=A0A6L7GL63_9ACTN|nr:FAD-dependent oxidoreductase [Gordonia mangrovi]MXP19991.1 NAD(P)-binding protein [Gordonia mangrovi]UVF79393.1 FAD-dependent oxidoreductase [Gordonia mangrovi]
MPAGTLIVGASHSGMQLAASLRENGDTEPIVLVGAEPHLPYHRPPLSKGLLAGTATVESLALRSESFYRDHGIDVVTGEYVTQIHRDSDGGEAITTTGARIDFGRLALTVGAEVVALPVPGADLEGVHYLRDLSDALAISVAVRAAHDVVVVGGGFIGLEAAATARKLGARVTVVEAAGRLMGRAVEEEISSFFLDAHRNNGIEVFLGSAVQEIRGADGMATGVELADGRIVRADLVLVGIGVRPRTALAESMGLECQDGVVVDEFGRASDGLTVAAGDCASMPNPAPGGSGRRRIESVNNATEHAKNAARTLLGNPAPYQLIPWFWSDQGDLKLQMVGDVSAPGLERVVRGEPSSGAFSVLFFDDGRLRGAQCVNRPVDFVTVRNLLGKVMTVNMAECADMSVPLKKLVVTSAAA